MTEKSYAPYKATNTNLDTSGVVSDLAALARFRCWVEIDLSAFRRNIRRMRQAVEGDVLLLLPVKADAYGHGVVEMTRAAAGEGVSCFGVSSLDEAILIRQAGIQSKIIFLTPPLPDQLTGLLKYNVTPILTSRETALLLGKLAASQGKTAVVHVEVDSGMGRTGIDWRHAAGEIQTISGMDGLRLEGVMTHFSRADDSASDYTSLQIERFEQVLSQLPAALSCELILHASNSAASIRFRSARYTMIRPGLYMYGLLPPGWEFEGIEEPEPVLSLKSRVILVKDVPENEPISYGGRWVTPSPRRIATVSAGYRDGVNYSLSSGGRVLIRGRSFPIVGAVCMDMIMVDLGEDKEITKGDVVTIIGEDGGERISAREIADVSGTIPYDVLCSSGMRVLRVYCNHDVAVKVESVLGTDRKGRSIDERRKE